MTGAPEKPYKLRQVKVGNIDDRISYIEYQILQGKRSPDIRNIAGKALHAAKVPSEAWEKEADVLFNFTRDNVRYTRDPHNVELFQSVERSLEHGIGDCDDQVIVLGALLQATGFPVVLRVIALKGSAQYQHIYLAVGLPPHSPTKYKPLDPSKPNPAGWEMPADQVGKSIDYVVGDGD